MEEKQTKIIRAPQTVPVRKGTVLSRAVVYHPVSLATKERQKHIHGTYVCMYVHPKKRTEKKGAKDGNRKEEKDVDEFLVFGGV